VGSPVWFRPWLDWLDAALRLEVDRLRVRYELAADEWHGLQVSDEQVDEALAGRGDRLGPPPGPDDEALAARRRALVLGGGGIGSPLRDLARRFDCTDVDLVALVLCLAPEVDLACQGVYAYLNDDATRRLPTVALCDRLAGSSLDTGSVTVAEGLVEVLRQPAAPLWRSAGLMLADPVRRYLLAADRAPAIPRAASPPPTASLGRPARVTVLESWSEAEAVEAARSLAARWGRRLVEASAAEPDLDVRTRQAVLRARLHDATLFVRTASLLDVSGEGSPEADRERWRQLLQAPVPLIVAVSPGTQLPVETEDVEWLVIGRPSVRDRQGFWEHELAARGLEAAGPDVAAVAAVFSLGPAQVRAACTTLARTGSTDYPALSAAARSRSGAALDSVAERVTADVRWDDLVVPPATARRLQQLASAVRCRREVFDAWQFGRLTGRASVRALFSGPSGTGKTMAASVVARELGLDLYRVDLSAVVSKYIGETEKNLERVLSAAERTDAVLLFDEADALFGRRSEVKDSHDRYANIEVAFLLQRIESFDGVLVLATNLAGNLDEAFTRRLPFQVAFPPPDEAARRELWRRALPATAPVADDIDPEFLAHAFPMTGGGIRSAALLAAFLAAHEGVPICMAHLVKAVARQRQHQGKVPSSAEFGPYLRLAREEGV
jgi:hypothetical protein